MSLLTDIYLLEAAQLNKAYFERFKKLPNYIDLNNHIQTQFKGLQSTVPNNIPALEKVLTICKNAIAYRTFKFGKDAGTEITSLLHDILLTFPTKFISKYAAMLNSDEKLDDIQQLKNEYKKDSTITGDENKIEVGIKKIKAVTYREIPNQNGKVVINNFKGSGKPKTFVIPNDFKWFYTETIDPDHAIFSDEDVKAMLNAPSGTGGYTYNVTALTRKSPSGRSACPIDAYRSGHCGGVPYVGNDGSPDELKHGYTFMLVDTKSDKHKITVFCDASGKVIEAKGNHNTHPTEEFYMNLLWLYNHDYIKGSSELGGYAADKNFYPFDFTDDEIVDHMYDFSGKEFNSEFDTVVRYWKQKFRNGEVSLDDIVNAIYLR